MECALEALKTKLHIVLHVPVGLSHRKKPGLMNMMKTIGVKDTPPVQMVNYNLYFQTKKSITKNIFRSLNFNFISGEIRLTAGNATHDVICGLAPATTETSAPRAMFRRDKSTENLEEEMETRNRNFLMANVEIIRKTSREIQTSMRRILKNIFSMITPNNE